jgi:ATP-dependent DNA helicase PIF1
MKSIFQCVDDCDNILLTGGAGVGKTYHTNKIIEHLRLKGRKFAVCAMTGLASQHLHFGMTIHRFLGVGGRTSKNEMSDLLDSGYFNNNLDSICHVSAIIIDEISMMRSDFFELLDAVLVEARSRFNIISGKRIDLNCDVPFGGYQLIFVGDFCQLPPVVPGNESVPFNWVFQHPLFTRAKFRVFNLTETKRTSDSLFATTLNKIRVGHCDQVAYDMIWNRVDAKVGGDATILMSRVQGVKDYNEARLKAHDGDSLLLSGTVSVREDLKGFDKVVKRLYFNSIKESGLEKEILLKVGCKVMLLTNNPEMHFSNGSQGIVLGTKKFDALNNIFISRSGKSYDLDYKYFGECLHIHLDNGEDVVVPKKPYHVYGHTFDENGKRMTDATFWQYPVTLGYAVSIHKSQGMSLDRVILDCKSIFADGQFYVGLSRARSLEGLSVLNFHPGYIRANHEAVDFYLNISTKAPGDYYGI